MGRHMGSSIRIISVPIDIYQAGSRLGSAGIEELNRDSPRSPAAIKRKKSTDLVACISINFIHHPDVEIR